MDKNDIQPFIQEIQKLKFSDIKNDISDYINNYYSIFSMSSNSSSSIMWSHYSKNHTGFMIEFNESDSLEEILKIEHARDFVIYSNDRPISFYDLAKKDNTEDVVTHAKNLLFNKGIEWEREEEFRIIISQKDMIATSTDSNGYPIYTKIIPSKNIESIYLGIRSNDILERKAKFWINNFAKHVKLFKAETCRSTFNIIYKEIKFRRTTDTRNP